MDKKILGFLFKLMIAFFLLIFAMGFFSEWLKPVLLPNVNVAAIGNAGIKRRVRQTGEIEPLYAEELRSLERVEVLELAVREGAYVRAGQPLMRLQRRMEGDEDNRYESLADAVRSLEDQSRLLLIQVGQGDDESDLYEALLMERQAAYGEMRALYELGLISERNWMEWLSKTKDLEALWMEAQVSEGDQARWTEKERAILSEKMERTINEMEDLRARCTVTMDERGWIAVPFDGIVQELPDLNQQVEAMESLAEIAAISDYTSVKLVTEISLSDYRWVGDNLLVYARTPEGLLKTYTENIYQTDHGTVVFESLFNKAFDDQIRIGQTYETMIERQQRFLGTVTIPKTLITAPDGFYDRGIGTVKIIREESGILGVEHYVDQVPIRMVVVGDERVITLPLEGLVVLNGDGIEAGTKVHINQ
jgi:multidrug efflux pump subunit AcrA (membrane-fusion protein)